MEERSGSLSYYFVTTFLSGDFSCRRNDEKVERHFEGGTTEKSPANETLTLLEDPLIFGTVKGDVERKST